MQYQPNSSVNEQSQPAAAAAVVVPLAPITIQSTAVAAATTEQQLPSSLGSTLATDSSSGKLLPPSSISAESASGLQQVAQSVKLCVANQNGEQTHFQIKRITAFSRLFTAYCTRNGIQPNTVRFLFDGQRLAPEKTPTDFEMQDGDVIDVVVYQTGGVV